VTRNFKFISYLLLNNKGLKRPDFLHFWEPTHLLCAYRRSADCTQVNFDCN